MNMYFIIFFERKSIFQAKTVN